LPRGLAALGWTEGQNIQSDQIQADNQSQDSTGYGTSSPADAACARRRRDGMIRPQAR
jgi:hypothetical protein